MAVLHVEVDEVDKREAREVLIHELQRLLHAVDVILVDAERAADAAAREDIRDLADADRRETLARERIHHRVARRIEREVVAARRARVVRVLADVRARDDAADAVLTLHDLARHAAVFVELLDRHIVLMRCNLQHAVGRRVDDQCARLLLLAAVVVDDLRARVRLVADDLAAERLLELCDDFRREAVGVRRHRALRDDARDLPVARRRVLATRELAQTGKGADWLSLRRAAADAVDVEEAELLHVRRIVLLRSDDGAQRVAVAVAKFLRIRLCADAEAVENNDERAFECLHVCHSFLLDFLMIKSHP